MKWTPFNLGQLLLIGLATLSFDLPMVSVRSQPSTPTWPQPTTVQFSQADQNQLTQLLTQAPRLQQQSWPQLIQTIAAKFEGAAYKGGLLDQSSQEELVLSLSQFDCVLFVETVLAIARTVTVDNPSPQVFIDAVQDQRYRQGQRQGYCSRLHYFSDWMVDNQRRKLVKNITPALGGIPLPKQLNFMSEHRQSYPQLQNNPTNWRCIQTVEARLQSLPLHYIPQVQIRGIEASLQPGDIIAVATAVPGLDVTHTGLLYQMPNQAKGLIHASPGGSVRIAPNLATYVANVDQSIGIIVARPQNPYQ